MTVTIGLATKDCVVLAADSAVTHGGAVTESRSSLGEASDTEKGIEEGALKIVALGSHAAVAMAGTASHAVEAVAWFKPFVHASNFEETWSKAMSVKQDLAFDLLVARWQDGSPELYRCVGAHAERIQPGRPVVVGANEVERTTLETRTRMLLLRGNRPHMIQLGVCALLVWRALNEVGFKDNIGGTPASLLVDAGGTAWMPDTSVYAVDVRSASDGEPHFHDMIHRVSIIGRDDVVAVASTYTNQTKLLENPLTQDRLMEWRDKWLVEVLNVARENTVTLVAMVALTQRRLAVLELDLCQNKYILVKNDEVEFGDELKRFFLAPSPTLPGGAVYSIPLGEPAALAMADAGGPADAYDVDLAVSYVLLVAVNDKNFDDAFRVWESMIARFPTHSQVLTVGVVAMENEPGTPRLDRVLTAWETALVADPVTLRDQARFVATQHPATPEIAARLLAAVAKLQ